MESRSQPPHHQPHHQPPHQPHDKFVHECLSVPGVAGPLLRHFCPRDWVDKLAWDRIRVEKSEFKFANAQRNSAHAGDMLFFIPLIDGDNGGLHCQLEHYSNNRPPRVTATAAYRDAFFAAMRRKSVASRTAPPQILLWQINLLQGPRPMATSSDDRRAQPTADPWYQGASFHQVNPLATLIDIGAMPFADLYAPRPESLFLLVAKAVLARRVMPHLTTILQNVKLVAPFSRSHYLRDVVLQYLTNGVAEIDKDPFFQTIKTVFPPPDNNNAMTLYESLINEGLEKGLEKGRKEGLDAGRKEGLDAGRKEGLDAGRKEGLDAGLQKGRTEAKRETLISTLISILTHRFGSVDESIHQRIHAADCAQCERWINRSLDATCIDNVFD